MWGASDSPGIRTPGPAYCVYDTDKQEIELRRVEYDVKTAQDKIIASGLPASLGDRLLIGM